MRLDLLEAFEEGRLKPQECGRIIQSTDERAFIHMVRYWVQVFAQFSVISVITHDPAYKNRALIAMKGVEQKIIDLVKEQKEERMKEIDPQTYDIGLEMDKIINSDKAPDARLFVGVVVYDNPEGGNILETFQAGKRGDDKYMFLGIHIQQELRNIVERAKEQEGKEKV